MRYWTFTYTAASIWTFGWLAARFGLAYSFFAAAIIFIPAAFAWRMLDSNIAIKHREYLYLGLITLASVSASAFIVSKWFDAGLDRLIIFENEYQSFRDRVNSLPEYRQVEVSYTRRKGGRVYLRGHVINKDSHDRLIDLLETIVRNSDSGYYDGVVYPGKLTESSSKPSS